MLDELLPLSVEAWHGRLSCLVPHFIFVHLRLDSGRSDIVSTEGTNVGAADGRLGLRDHLGLEGAVLDLSRLAELSLHLELVLPRLVPDLLPLVDGQPLVMRVGSLARCSHQCGRKAMASMG